jgi:hypothetical protein
MAVSEIVSFDAVVEVMELEDDVPVVTLVIDELF